MKLEIDDVAHVAVVGDTAADMQSGRRAGASIVAGVLGGVDDRSRLEKGGATTVISSITDLVSLLAPD